MNSEHMYSTVSQLYAVHNTVIQRHVNLGWLKPLHTCSDRKETTAASFYLVKVVLRLYV